jgi:hypothetical protein
LVAPIRSEEGAMRRAFLTIVADVPAGAAMVLVTTVMLLMGEGTSKAEVIEVPLLALHGTYAEGATISRTAAFQLERGPVVVHGAWLQLSGVATAAETECDGGGTYPWPVDFSASMEDVFSGGLWIAGGATSGDEGAFDIVDGFWPIVGATWEFLKDGAGEIELYGTPAPLVGMCWPITPPPEVIIEEAVLIVDADFPVPAEGTTWGALKALYED